MKAIRPQDGFQEQFLSSEADIVIGGSGAGVGKTFACLLEPLRHIDNSDFGAVFFRKTYSQITNEGALWDESQTIYPLLGAKSNKTDMLWTFPNGSRVSFSHLQYEKDIFNHQGGQYALIVFDELTHFSENMFFYLLSRNRSKCGVKPYVRATCNPDPDSWVAKFVEWYVDQETGYPIKEHSGVLRYFTRSGGNVIWGNSKQDVIDQVPFLYDNVPEDIDKESLIKSFTFIPGSIYDNKELLSIDPSYLGNLLAQDDQKRLQLLEGNWKVSLDALALFDYNAINDAFTNYLQPAKEKYITCDAARFGRDFCVIMVWNGWEVIAIEVIKQSDVNDIITAIESKRKRFGIQQSNVLIDQDGVGAASVRMGNYKGFSGGEQPKKIKGLKENYKNLKTQCFYYLAEQVLNIGAIKINVNNENCIVDGVFGSKIKMGTKTVDIMQLIKDDLRSIKRKDVDNEGKQQINSKEEQKAILGRSPDFADTLMMRAVFDMTTKLIYM